MKTYSFLTEKGFRIDVKGLNPKQAFKKLNLIQHITKFYYEYDEDGFVNVDNLKFLNVEVNNE